MIHAAKFSSNSRHSVRRIMCLKQDVDSWETAFGKLKSVHFLTKLIFSDLVDRTRAQIMSLESKIPRDRAFGPKTINRMTANFIV